MVKALSEEPIEVEAKPIQTKNECIVIPDHMKPLFECCKDFDEGRIDSNDFFARALIRTGEFMQAVKGRTSSE